MRALVDDTIGFQKFTAPMQTLLLEFLASDRPTFCVSSAHPRIVAGKPSKNPRYLQDAQARTPYAALHPFTLDRFSRAAGPNTGIRSWPSTPYARPKPGRRRPAQSVG